MISKSTNENKKDYILSDNNIKYEFIIEKTNNHISIKHKNYIKLINDSNLKDFKLLNINNINDVYNFLINKFQTNKAKIKEIQKNLNIKLEISPNILLELLYKISINKIPFIANPKNRITSAKNNKKLNKNDDSKINSGKLKLNNTLIKGSFCVLQRFQLIGKIIIPTMDAFNSIDTKLLYIVYINKITNIIFYNCMNNKITCIIKEAHGFIQIINVRHYLYDKKDIILSASSGSNIKLWKFITLECFLEIKNNNNYNLISACLFKDKNQYFIAAAYQLRNLKVYDMNGKQIKEVQKIEKYTYEDITREEYEKIVNGIHFIDIYFDKQSSKNYILCCGVGLLKSYDYHKGKLFNNYLKTKGNNTYYHFVIYDNGIIVKLITTHSEGKIRIFNFNSAELLSEIKIDIDSKKIFSSLCLWNNNYLFVANEKCSLKLIDIEKKKVIKTFPKEAENGIFVKKFNHPLYGKCILSQHKDETITLWVKDN